jgi:YggT family protein
MDYSFSDFPAASFLIGSILSFLKIYFAIIIARILLTWFPNIDWMQQIASFISPVVDPYLNLFRFIPPIGAIDISSIVAIFALQILIDNLAPFAPRSFF